MRILMIAHNCVLESNQEKLVELSMYDDVELTLLAPPYNLEPMGWVKVEKKFDPRYEIIVAHSFWPWILKQRYLQFYPALPWILKRTKPEIIDLWEEPWSLVSYLTLKLAGRYAPEAKIVHETEQNITKHYPPPFRNFEEYVLDRTDHFIARNSEGVDILRDKGFEGPVDVIPNALNCDAFNPCNPVSLKRKLNLKHFTIGFIGRIEKEKGLITLFEAMAPVSLPYQLLIIGKGSLKPRLQALAREKGFEDRCVFVDAVPQSEVPRYMNCMDVMVLPSLTTPTWKEQFGRTLIEAMACEVPVIGSDSGSIPGVIGDAGIVFPEGDADRLREALLRLLTDRRLCRNYVKLGTQRLKQKFQWSVVARDMRLIYRRVLDLEPYPEVGVPVSFAKEPEPVPRPPLLDFEIEFEPQPAPQTELDDFVSSEKEIEPPDIDGNSPEISEEELQ